MNFTTRLIVALGLAAAPTGAVMAAPGAPSHDGTWSVQMVTNSGMCDRSYNYSIAVENGNVRYILAPGDSPTIVNGKIQPNGSLNLDIRRSVAKVDASGELNVKSGSGTWKLGMLGCSGRWTAQKRSSTISG
ncbi:hypothetical protein [Microvirga sp. 2TAF3]|uniref:hypothetical protein n=1 Tax=Microvirga sp. 2TAF3 TaxID=3233014 RepID=UPI003F9BDCD8